MPFSDNPNMIADIVYIMVLTVKKTKYKKANKEKHQNTPEDFKQNISHE
jgi:hypothetical protein